MNMVLIGANLQKYQIIPLAYFQTDITKRLIDRQINNDTTRLAVTVQRFVRRQLQMSYQAMGFGLRTLIRPFHSVLRLVLRY